ncbi:MAG TPA: M24 family metallopeptidase [Solirubrobacterales bacterium]|nr:M24 family metallopeptidase [Solirubrobacterales bacterium]
MSTVGAGVVGTRTYFPREEYQKRLSALEAELTSHGYGAMVIWQRTGGSYDRAGDVYYLTSYASQSSGQELSAGASQLGRSFAALLVRVGEEPELHICEPAETVDMRLVAIERIVGHEQNLPAGLGARLRELGIEGKVAYLGEDFLPLQMHRALVEAAPGIEWIAEEYLLREIKSRKSELELDLYREAGSIAGRALTKLMEGLIKGERQCDAAADAADVIIRAGGGFQRIGAATGPASEYSMWDRPLYGYSDDRADPGDFVRGWVYGPILDGYWLDPGRSSVAGKPSPEAKKLIEDTVELTEAIMAEIRPGKTPREVGIFGDAKAEKLGYDASGGAIWDIYGHGLSTFWLGPFIPSHGAVGFEDDHGLWNVDSKYHDGQVYTVETFLQQPGVGMASFEEVFIVWEDDLEVVTDTPMLFW